MSHRVGQLLVLGLFICYLLLALASLSTCPLSRQCQVNLTSIHHSKLDSFRSMFHVFRKNKHFESSQKLRKDGIGIWENFIRNMLSNLKLCYLNWKWVESDRHFDCYWYIWNKVKNRKVILLNYDIWNEKEWTGTEHYTY